MREFDPLLTMVVCSSTLHDAEKVRQFRSRSAQKLNESFLEIRRTGGAYTFANIPSSAVRISSHPRSLRPCWMDLLSILLTFKASQSLCQQGPKCWL